MELHKVAETSNTITVGWTPVPGCEGYLFFKDGVRVSRTLDPSRNTVKFSKPFQSLMVQAFVFSTISQGSYPGVVPPPFVAPRTYNAAPGGEPSSRFCTTGLPRNAQGSLYDSFSTYDDDGRDLGGRTAKQVQGLKPANEMDGRGPCDPYGVFPPWPAGSYER